MQDSMYSALFGALSNEFRLNLISNNLANVNTTGYKQDKVSFKDTFQHFAHDYILDSKPFLRGEALWPDPDVKAKPRLSEQTTDFSQGGLHLTGNPLDFAIQGDGFFQVQDPTSGATFLTRNGNFSLNAEGQIVDANGNYLLAGGSAVAVPPGSVLSVDKAGNIQSGGQVLGTIDLMYVEDPKKLQRVGKNLYTVPPDAGVVPQPLQPGMPVADASGDSQTIRSTINQGYLEASNVEIVPEMVRMIEVNRSFEAYNKIMQESDSIDKRVISTVSKS